MEKNGKKITAVVIAAVLIVVMLLGMMGCQSGGGEPDPTETTGATAATTEATGEPTSEPTEGSEPTTEPAETSEATGEPTEEPTEETTEATQPVTEPGHEHSYTKTTVNPTCTNGGYTLNTCDCGDSYKSGETKATGHDYGKTVINPTCTAKGYTTYTCKRCSDSYKADYTDAKGHNYTSKVTKEATCKENGIRAYTCSICGNSYTETISNKGIAHTWGGWYTTREPSETATGTAERKCSVCAAIETKTLDKLEPKPTEPANCEHDYNRICVPATCIKDGYFACTCKHCGDYYEEFFSSKSDEYHKYSLISSVPGDCSAGIDGYETYKCSVCGDSYTQTVAGGHSWVHHHTDEVGHYKRLWVCHCGGWSCEDDDPTVSFVAHTTQVKEETGTIAGHSYYSTGEWVVDTPAVDYYECSVCGAKK